MEAARGWALTASDAVTAEIRKNAAILVLIVASLNMVFIGGKRRCFGIFLADLHNFTTPYSQAMVSKTELNWIGDSYAAIGFFMMPFATTIILKLKRCYRASMAVAGLLIFTSCLSSSFVSDPAQMFFTHTVLHGFGSTIIMSVCALIVGEYFDSGHRFHVLATTFAAGGPLGSLIFCPLYSIWIANLGWRATFRILAVLFLVEVNLGTLTFLPKEEVYEDLDEEGTVKEEQEKQWGFVSLQEIKDKPHILIWMFERTVHTVIMYSFSMNLTDFVKDILHAASGGGIQMAYAIGECVVYLTGAMTGDRLRGKLPFIYLIGTIVLAFFCTIWQFTQNNYYLVMFLAVVVGASIGVGNTFLYATSEEVMETRGYISFPMTQMGGSIGLLLAPECSGLIIDKFGYRGFFVAQAVLAVICMLLMMLVNVLLWRHKQTEELECQRRRNYPGPSLEDIQESDEEKPEDVSIYQNP